MKYTIESIFPSNPLTQKEWIIPYNVTHIPVFTWHIYQPRSFSSTSFMCKYHDRWSLCVRLILWFCVITLWWIDSIVCVSTRTHATYLVTMWHKNHEHELWMSLICVLCVQFDSTTIRRRTKKKKQQQHRKKRSENTMRIFILYLFCSLFSVC